MLTSRFLAARILFRPPRLYVSTQSRSFRWSPQRRAEENKEAFFQAFQHTTIFKKLADHPDALVALEDFAKLLQEKGFDLSSGKPPSTLQMIKLASNADFRDGAKRVGETLEKAGVDLKSKEIMQEMMTLMSLKKESK